MTFTCVTAWIELFQSAKKIASEKIQNSLETLTLTLWGTAMALRPSFAPSFKAGWTINNLIFMVLGKNKGGVHTYSKFLYLKYFPDAFNLLTHSPSKVVFPLSSHPSRPHDHGISHSF